MARRLAKTIQYYFGLFVILIAFLGFLVRMSFGSDLSYAIFEATHSQIAPVGNAHASHESH